MERARRDVCRRCGILPLWRLTSVAGMRIGRFCRPCSVAMSFRCPDRQLAVWAALAEVERSFPGSHLEVTMLERRERRSAADVGVDEATAKRFPLLADYLAQSRWPDGSERELATLLVCFEGTWKAGLLDKAEGQSLWASSETLAGVLEALEKRLAKAGPADWREMRDKGRKRS